MQFFYSPGIPSSGFFTLDSEESRHCLRVLRKKIGDKINVVDGKGNFYEAEIINDRGRLCEIKILSHRRHYGKRDFKLAIAIAMPKNTQRLEWFLEKATEIGIDEIYPMLTERTERTRMNTHRLGKVIISAMKQSAQAYLPVLHEPKKFSDMMITGVVSVMQKFIAVCGIENARHLKDAYQKGNDALVLIGPEGNFTGGEVKLATASGFTPVSLGRSRLRVETAGVAACLTINLMNE